nr:ADP-ribosylglycohydrolase family protein [Chthonobacter rhizosphaerae]
MIGGACGDALGAPVEFLHIPEIRRVYGDRGITDFDTAYGVFGAITDDTQMTLFTVEGLIRAEVRFSLKGICHPPAVVHHAYQRWYATQQNGYDDNPELLDLDGWLIKERRLWSRRAPGNTCLSALKTNRSLSESAKNDSKGCGTVMRDAPFGFLPDVEQAFRFAVQTARTTHGHPSAAFSSGALALMINSLAKGCSLPDAVQAALVRLRGEDGAGEVVESVRKALDIAGQPDWRQRLPEVGRGWVAEEALAISVLCALAADTPEEALIAAVNHDGDSDSTGAIAGNLLGTLHGSAAFPTRWTERVELADVIAALSADFATMIEGRLDAESVWDRYPGH